MNTPQPSETPRTDAFPRYMEVEGGIVRDANGCYVPIDDAQQLEKELTAELEQLKMALEINKSPDHADEVVALCNTLGDVKAELKQATKERDELFDVAEKLYEALGEHYSLNCFCNFKGTCSACIQLQRKEEALSLAKQHGLGKDKQ